MISNRLSIGVPTSPIVNPINGILNTEWRAFFVALQMRTGGTVGTDLAVVEQQLNAEQQARIQGDQALGTSLDNEAQIRKDADTQLNTAIGDEATTRALQDGLKLSLSGGTMSGPVNVLDPVTNTQPVTLQYFNTHLPTGGGIPEAPTDGTIYGRQGSSASWHGVLPLTGGTLAGPGNLQINGTLGVTGAITGSSTLTTSGTIQSNTDVRAAGVVYAATSAAGDFYLGRPGMGYRILNWAANWWMGWNESNGTVQWQGPSGWLMYLDGGGNLTATGVYGAYVYSSGSLRAASWAFFDGDQTLINGNGVAYRWNTGQFIAQSWNGTNFDYYVNGGYVGSGISDARAKDVTGDYEYGMAQLRRINPVRFTWKGNTHPPGVDQIHDSTAPQVGVIAQNIETVIPEMIEQRDGWIDEQAVTDFRSITSANWLIYALLNAVKELDVRVTRLEREQGIAP